MIRVGFSLCLFPSLFICCPLLQPNPGFLAQLRELDENLRQQRDEIANTLSHITSPSTTADTDAATAAAVTAAVTATAADPTPTSTPSK